MGIWRGEDRTVELFAARFEQDGTNYLFRRNLKASPVRVTADERDLAIADFKRGVRWLMAGAIVATVLAAAIFVAIDPGGFDDRNGTRNQIDLWGMTLAIMGGFGVIWFRLWSAPSRQFGDRVPAKSAMSSDEVRAITFNGIKWSNLAILPVFAFILLIPGRHERLWDSSWTIKLFLALAMLIGAAVQAVRKWRFEQKED